MMRVVALLVVVLICSHGNGHGHTLGVEDADGYVHVPGGKMLHKSCVHEVADGVTVDAQFQSACKYPAKIQNAQVYAIDTHFTGAAGKLMASFNASFNVPGLPPTHQGGQVNYFWPGFKSTDPTMGLPVLQPVLQYGTDSEGGGAYWCLRSWFVYGNIGEAFVSPLVRVAPNDILTSYMQYDNASSTWIIYGKNTNGGQDTTLKIARAKVHNTDFKVAMLVLETILPPNNCKLLPGPVNAVTFTGVSVNGAAAPWVTRVALHDCGQAVAVAPNGDVKMTWHN